jgi:hypothetical protein
VGSKVRAALRGSSVWAPLGGLSGLARAASAAGRPSCWPMGLPSAIWGGRRAAPAIGHPVAERLPEIDVQQRPLPAPACNGTREPSTGDAAGGCSIRIRHLHPSPGPRHTARDGDCSASLPGTRCTACVAPGLRPTSASLPACRCHRRAVPCCARCTADARSRLPSSAPPCQCERATTADCA